MGASFATTIPDANKRIPTQNMVSPLGGLEAISCRWQPRLSYVTASGDDVQIVEALAAVSCISADRSDCVDGWGGGH